MLLCSVDFLNYYSFFLYTDYVYIYPSAWEFAICTMHEERESILYTVLSIFYLLPLTAHLFVLWKCYKRLGHSHCVESLQDIIVYSVTIIFAFLIDRCSDFKNARNILLIFLKKINLCIVAAYSLYSIPPNAPSKETFNLCCSFHWVKCIKNFFKCVSLTSLWCQT